MTRATTGLGNWLGIILVALTTLAVFVDAVQRVRGNEFRSALMIGIVIAIYVGIIILTGMIMASSSSRDHELAYIILGLAIAATPFIIIDSWWSVMITLILVMALSLVFGALYANPSRQHMSGWGWLTVFFFALTVILGALTTAGGSFARSGNPFIAQWDPSPYLHAFLATVVLALIFFTGRRHPVLVILGIIQFVSGAFNLLWPGIASVIHATLVPITCAAMGYYYMLEERLPRSVVNPNAIWS